MPGVVFRETLRQTWRQTLYWGVGLGALALLVVSFVPLFDAFDFGGLLRSLPPVMLAAVGVSTDIEFAMTPEGIIATGFFGKMALFLVVYPVVMGMRVTTNEEDDGTLDMLLSLPVPRWRVVLEKSAAFLVSAVAIALLVLVGLGLGASALNLTLNMGRLAESALNLIPMMFLVLVFTTFLGALLGRRRLVLALATVFVLGSFMLDTVGSMAQGTPAETVRAVSFFSYFNPLGVMQYGLAWGNILLLLGISAALLAGSLWVFQRRDVGV